jgi:hypothetical protein
MSSSILSDLLVIDINDESKLPPLDPAWRKHFLEIEGCTGQLFLGNVADKNKIPAEIIGKGKAPARPGYPQVLILEGREAYDRMLQIYCGLHEKHFGGKEIGNNIKRNWEAAINAERNGHAVVQQRIRKYGKVVEALIADGRHIRAQTMEDIPNGHYVRPTSNNFSGVAARNLVHLPTDTDILVIADKEHLTLGTLTALDGRHRRIAITHPDPAQLEDLHHQITTSRLNQQLKGDYDYVPFDKAMAGNLRNMPFVFNCRPMDSGPEDAALAEAWKARPDNGGTLIHLRGVPKQRDATSATWERAKAGITGDNKIILPEDIRQQREADKGHNHAIRKLAEHAIANCALSRAHGLQPVYKYMLREPGAYGQLITGREAQQNRFSSHSGPSGQSASGIGI